jgi:hypothetical protein
LNERENWGLRIEEPHVNPAPQHREVWLRDPDGYVVVMAGPDWRGEFVRFFVAATKTRIRTHMAYESCDGLAVGRNDVEAVKAVRSDYLAEAKGILF